MRNGYWNEGMGGSSWWWIPMMIMMIAFWGGLIWIGVTLIRRGSHTPQLTAPTSPTPARPGPPEILAERLARGEIEPDEYRRRLDALHQTPTA